VKAIVGVDSQGCYKPGLCLFAKMRFSKPEVVLLNAVDTTLPFAPMTGNEVEVQAEYSKVVQNLGLSALDYAIDEACVRGLNPKTKLVFGAPAQSLITEAEKANADMVVVCASHKGLWSTSFLGSVSRSLCISCRTSVLVAKEDRKTPPTLTVVFATDHSKYCERALERFIQMRPTGIKHVHVVSAYKVDDHEAKVLEKNLPALGGQVDQWIEERLEEKNAEVQEKLCRAGYNTSTRVVRGEANDVIREAMRDTRADLLVLGAQGHGFFERALAGSVALHQVVAEPYPVLIVRA